MGHRFEAEPYNPEAQYAVIRSSICIGEKVAGFKGKKHGHFTQVMLIRSQKGIENFKSVYKVDSIKAVNDNQRTNIQIGGKKCQNTMSQCFI